MKKIKKVESTFFLILPRQKMSLFLGRINQNYTVMEKMHNLHLSNLSQTHQEKTSRKFGSFPDLVKNSVISGQIILPLKALIFLVSEMKRWLCGFQTGFYQPQASSQKSASTRGKPCGCVFKKNRVAVLLSFFNEFY